MKTEHTPELMYDEIWLQCPNRDSMSEWYGEVTWAEDKINDDDTKYIRADIAESLKQQRDGLLKAAEAIEIDAEECLDFDECTAMLVPIDTYHKLMEAIASVKGGA